jgi:transcriptional regulator with XRE-family HTH domain
MEKAPSQPKARSSIFGQLLAEKRAKAGLSLQELATLTRLPLSLLEGLEREGREVPSFDVCYKIAQAINSRQMQGFVVQDLWQAASMDKAALHSRASNSSRLQQDPPSPVKPRDV